jgi:hypothetical protein
MYLPRHGLGWWGASIRSGLIQAVEGWGCRELTEGFSLVASCPTLLLLLLLGLSGSIHELALVVWTTLAYPCISLAQVGGG